jgi:hypothetical protein
MDSMGYVLAWKFALASHWQVSRFRSSPVVCLAKRQGWRGYERGSEKLENHPCKAVSFLGQLKVLAFPAKIPPQLKFHLFTSKITKFNTYYNNHKKIIKINLYKLNIKILNNNILIYYYYYYILRLSAKRYTELLTIRLRKPFINKNPRRPSFAYLLLLVLLYALPTRGAC